jgi:signal transduction histidine kinase
MRTTTTQTGWGNPSLAVSYLDGLTDPVVVLDPGGCVREGNAAFFRFVSGVREQLLDADLGQVLAGDARLAPFVDRLRSMAEVGVAARVMIELPSDTGMNLTLLLTGIPLGAGSTSGLLAVRVEDVSEMVRERAASDAERTAAHDSARALERLNAELEGFSYSVAHDLRAPLRFIDKFAYLLVEHHSQELSSEGLQYAEQIREGTRQMAQLVEDLLQFSRVTGQELRRERIDMDRLVHQVVEDAQYDIEDREVAFSVGPLGIAMGDAALVRQIFVNLIGNAVKFTRRQPQARVAISRRALGPVAVYSVADNGVGFDASEADRLFTVFQRYHQPDDFEGSGVGLAVVKRVVSRHGGAVWAESEVGHGATFHFTLEPASKGTAGDPGHGR